MKSLPEAPRMCMWARTAAHVALWMVLWLVPVPGTASAQDRTLLREDPPAQVMILGTYHFANPGQDVINVEAPDVKTPEKQAEVQVVLRSLLEFEPTKIAIEGKVDDDAYYDSLYAAYREGRHTLTRNERQQLGFRLADAMGHKEVYAIDHEGQFPFSAVMAFAQEHDTTYVRQFQQFAQELRATLDSLQQNEAIIDNLRAHNDPEYIDEGHAFYVRTAEVGRESNYVGADLLTEWYKRNIRIFANLARITEPGDRVIVIFGSGHSAILRELVQSSDRMELVDPLHYL